MEKILNWIKEHKAPLIAGAVILVLLAAAFWYGSGSPDSKGFSVAKKQETASDEREAERDKEAETKAKAAGAAADNAVSADTKETIENLIAQAQEAVKQTASLDEAGSNEGVAEAADNSQDNNSNQGEGTSQPKSSQSTVSAGGQTINIPNSGTMVINPDTGKDQYQTDPVPAGKPEPVEPEPVGSGADTYRCTISISCATILDNMELLDKKMVNLIPKDGWILKPVTVSFQEGESVFDVLQRVCREKEIPMEFSNTPMYNSAYIEGIYNIYEFDVGSLSGWTYKVNDWFPNYGCSRYPLKDGDVINWMYTCNLGKDVGGSNATGQ